MPFLRVYPASKTIHAQKWRDLQDEWKNIHFTARWIRQVTLDQGDILQTEASVKYARRCWIEDEEDIRGSDYLMLYAEEGEHLRGGLVEAGIAIAAKIPVIVIGKHSDYGSWHHHPNVIPIANLSAVQSYIALMLARRIANH